MMPQNNHHYRAWLEKADADFRYASWSLKNATDDDFFSFILFHFHQAAEKYLKAYIIYAKLPFQKIHDLPELLQQISSADKKVEEITEEASLLNEFYVDTRYPAHWPIGYTKDLAYKAQAATEAIGDFVKGKLSPEGEKVDIPEIDDQLSA